MAMRDKKVVVTGGAGFVGSHLVDYLIELEANVIVLDDLSHGRHINPMSEFYRADVSSVETCRFFFEDAYAVFNLAATVAGVDWNKDNNAAMFKGNVDVLIPPVIAAQDTGVLNFVQMSSVCIYSPDNQDSPEERTGYRRFTHPANWGYGQAKRDGELAALEWADLNHVVVARPTNMYGARDHFQPIEMAHVIPALIQRIDNAMPGGKLEVYGKPDAVREFMYVEDCVRALVHLVDNAPSGVYNIGTGGETALTIRELVGKLSGIMNKPVEAWWNIDRGGGDDIRRSNVDKIRSTGWNHEIDLDTGLEATYQWYKEYIKDD